MRFKPKTFFQRLPGADKWGIGDVRRVLYHLPELLAANPEHWVLIVEGEKDVETAESLGFVATCNPMGAGHRKDGGNSKWLPEFSEVLRGRYVVIIPDDDPVDPKLGYSPGIEHAADIGRSLLGKVAGLKWLRLTANESKADLSDWVAAGGSAELLWELIEQAPDRVQQKPEQQPVTPETQPPPEPSQQPENQPTGSSTYPMATTYGKNPDDYDPLSHRKAIAKRLAVLAAAGEMPVSCWCDLASQEIEHLRGANAIHTRRLADSILDEARKRAAAKNN